AADDGGGAEDAAGRGGRGGDVGDVRGTGLGGAAGDRAAGVRVPPAVADPDRAGGGDGGGGEARPLRRRPRLPDAGPGDAERAVDRGVRGDRRRRRHRERGGDAAGVLDRGPVRAAAGALDVVAGDRGRRGRRGGVLRAADAGRGVREHQRDHLGGAGAARVRGVPVRDEADLVVG